MKSLYARCAIAVRIAPRSRVFAGSANDPPNAVFHGVEVIIVLAASVEEPHQVGGLGCLQLTATPSGSPPQTIGIVSPAEQLDADMGRVHLSFLEEGLRGRSRGRPRPRCGRSNGSRRFPARADLLCRAGTSMSAPRKDR